jgi:hypothetical protein
MLNQYRLALIDCPQRREVSSIAMAQTGPSPGSFVAERARREPGSDSKVGGLPGAAVAAEPCLTILTESGGRSGARLCPEGQKIRGCGRECLNPPWQSGD